GSPGMYEEQFFKALGKNANFSIIVVPWYNPRSAPSRAISAAFPKMFPNESLPGHIFNIGFTFEAMMVAADAARRAGSTQGEALIAALRQTNI
ncbi:ABC transporter substrate-binding protein, partial [Acinetobacter baumannii]